MSDPHAPPTPAQTPTDTADYKAFGLANASSGSTTNPFRWVGKLGYYWQPDTSDHWLRARVYRPQVGRFVSRDPLLQVNRYGWPRTSPIGAVDPSGRKGCKLYEDVSPTGRSSHYAYQCDCGGNQAQYRCVFRSPWPGAHRSRGLHSPAVRVASVKCDCAAEKQSCSGVVELWKWHGKEEEYRQERRRNVKGHCTPWHGASPGRGGGEGSVPGGGGGGWGGGGGGGQQPGGGGGGGGEGSCPPRHGQPSNEFLPEGNIWLVSDSVRPYPRTKPPGPSWEPDMTLSMDALAAVNSQVAPLCTSFLAAAARYAEDVLADGESKNILSHNTGTGVGSWHSYGTCLRYELYIQLGNSFMFGSACAKRKGTRYTLQYTWHLEDTAKAAGGVFWEDYGLPERYWWVTAENDLPP